MASQPSPLPTTEPSAPFSQNDTQSSPFAGQPPTDDPAETLLRNEPSITDEQRASLWDVFHNAKDPNELAQKLQVVLAPQDLKHALWTAKQVTAPVSSQVDKVSAALQKLKDLDPAVLSVAEKFPNVAKAFIDAAIKPAETQGAAAGKREPAGKGKEAQKTAPLAQPPRRDGGQHLPPIPANHYRIRASNGGIHDIPAENIEKARQIDPDLHVLNP